MTLREAIEKREMGAIIKHDHMFDIYDSHFGYLQDEPLNILEIGVYNGGTLYMWREYFPNAKIVGIDIDPFCLRWKNENKNIFVEVGDQCDVEFLKQVNEKYGPFDIIIDDGGHENHQILTSLEVLYPLLKNGGYYVVEDTFCSYWPDYSCDREYSTTLNGENIPSEKLNLVRANYDPNNTSMTFLKQLADKVNSWAYKKEDFDVYEKSLFSISFYDSLCFLHKFEKHNNESYGKSIWIEHNRQIPRM